MSEDLVEVVARAIDPEFWKRLDTMRPHISAATYQFHWAADVNASLARARAAISAINASGIAKVAPVVATLKMRNAGNECAIREGDNARASLIWSAMISAVEG